MTALNVIYAYRLVLAPGAIPSIHLDPSMQEKIVSPSKQVDSTPVSAKNRRKLIREALNEPYVIIIISAVYEKVKLLRIFVAI